MFEFRVLYLGLIKSHREVLVFTICIWIHIFIYIGSPAFCLKEDRAPRRETNIFFWRTLYLQNHFRSHLCFKFTVEKNMFLEIVNNGCLAKKRYFAHLHYSFKICGLTSKTNKKESKTDFFFSQYFKYFRMLLSFQQFLSVGAVILHEVPQCTNNL